MSTRDSLLRAVRQSPDDDGPRLVLADWLEEHGDAADRDRAAFIRAQLELARRPPWDPLRLDLGPAEADLLRRQGAASRAGLPAALRGRPAGFRRGFLEHVEVTPSQLARGLDGVGGRAHPLRGVRIRGGTPGTASALARSPGLAAVRDLDLRATGIDALGHLAASPFLTGVERLWLTAWGAWPGAVLTGLLGAPARPALRELCLLDRSGLAGAADALAVVPVLGQLRSLVVGGGDCADQLAVAAAVPGRCDHLVHLGLPESESAGAGLSALALAGLPSLRSLDLAGYRGGPTGAAVARAPWLGQLRSLELRATRTGPTELRALTEAAGLAGVVRLGLAQNPLGADGLEALAASPNLGALRDLDLSHLSRGGRGWGALARSGLPARLRRLAVVNCLKRDDLLALLASPAGERLSSFDLSSTPLEGRAAAALAGSGWLRGVVTLGLGSARLGDAGAAELARCDHARALRVLHLEDNQIGPAGAAVLAGSPLLSGLTELHLGNNPLGQGGVRALAESPHLGRLSYLALDSCDLGPDGVRTLAGATNMPRLACLDVTGNDAGEALRAFLDSPHRAGLTDLRWAGNEAGVPGLNTDLLRRFGGTSVVAE